MAKRILVVDDDPDLRETSRIVLENLGYDVVEAGSGAEALKTLSGTDVHLVILDVMMETETEGFHLAYEVRKDPELKDTPIIMLTSIETHTGEELSPDESGDYLPVDAFLRKPLNRDELKAKLDELLG